MGDSRKNLYPTTGSKYILTPHLAFENSKMLYLISLLDLFSTFWIPSLTPYDFKERDFTLELLVPRGLPTVYRAWNCHQ